MGRPCPDEAAVVFEALRKAYAGNDYAAFCAVVGESVKTAISPDRFRIAATAIGPILADPARISYMDVLKEGERQIHCWRVAVGSARVFLVRIDMKRGKAFRLLFTRPFDVSPGAGAKAKGKA